MGVLRLYDGFVHLIQCLRGVNVGIAMKRTAKDLVAARVGSWPYIKRRLSNDKGFGNEPRRQRIMLIWIIGWGREDCTELDD